MGPQNPCSAPVPGAPRTQPFSKDRLGDEPTFVSGTGTEKDDPFPVIGRDRDSSGSQGSMIPAGSGVSLTTLPEVRLTTKPFREPPFSVVEVEPSAGVKGASFTVPCFSGCLVLSGGFGRSRGSVH